MGPGIGLDSEYRALPSISTGLLKSLSGPKVSVLKERRFDAESGCLGMGSGPNPVEKCRAASKSKLVPLLA